MLSTPRQDDWKSILLIVFSALGILGLSGRGAYLVISGILSFHTPTADAINNLASNILDAMGMLFCSLLLLPAIYYNLQRLHGKDIQDGKIPAVKLWHLIVLIAIWLLVILFGSILAGSFQYGWAVASPLFPLGLALPVAGLAWIATGGLPTGSRRRLWSVFGIGMAGSTFVAILLEYMVVGIGLVVFSIFLIAHPQLLSLLNQLKYQLNNTKDMQTIITILAPYLANPLVFAVIALFFAVIGPMIEEAIKPVAIWLLGKRLHSNAEGFALGALCGAGFALLEGLMAASGSPRLWAFGMAGRAVSSLMHITASAIMGWGIAGACLEKRYGRLIGAYLVSIGIHGLWNGSVILAVLGGVQASAASGEPGLAAILAMLAGMGALLILFPLMMILLPVINKGLRPAVPAQAKSQAQNDV